MKVWRDGERYVCTAEGNGPVQRARQGAARRARRDPPDLPDIELVNFKVRILDEAKGTGAITRVLIDASDGRETWGSIGVSENVIAASGRRWSTRSSTAAAGGRPRRGPPPRVRGE